MTTLHDRLSDLADEEPPASTHSAPPGDLWSTGRRMQRRRRAGTAVILVTALVVLAGVGGLGLTHGRTSVQPAGVETELGMPDQIWAADEHLPGTDDTGPIGPLVAVVPTVRDSWLGESTSGVVGISATGEYAFLDLPHAISSAVAHPALSADGRHVAYWRSGTPSGEPGDVTQSGDRTPPVGVAVYDTVTGRTYEHLVETEHGLQPENLVWAGDRLWFDVWQMDAPEDDGSQAASLETVLSWLPATDDVRPATGRVDLSRATAWGEAVLTSHRDRLRRSTPEHTDLVGVLDSVVFDFQTPFYVSRDASRVAVQESPGAGQSWRLLTGELASEGGTVSLEEVAPSRGGYRGTLVGWRDDEHVVVHEPGGGTGEGTYLTVEVRTGEAEILGYAEGEEPILATNALRGPVFEAPEPPTPLNPFVLAGAGLATVLAAGACLLTWRRRVQR